MEHKEIIEIIQLLADNFDLPMPNVNYKNTGKTWKNGMYRHSIKTIFIGSHAWRGKDCILHEFAHYLQWTRKSRAKTHGIEFKRALIDVVMVWYGNVYDYHWQSEYKAIRAWYLRNYPVEALLLDKVNIHAVKKGLII